MRITRRYAAHTGRSDISRRLVTYYSRTSVIRITLSELLQHLIYHLVRGSPEKLVVMIQQLLAADDSLVGQQLFKRRDLYPVGNYCPYEVEDQPPLRIAPQKLVELLFVALLQTRPSLNSE